MAFGRGRRYEAVREDLLQLKDQGYEPVSIVSHGHKAILKAVNKVFSKVPQQCCLGHIIRQCTLWLTHRPKTEVGKALRQLRLRHRTESRQKPGKRGLISGPGIRHCSRSGPITPIQPQNSSAGDTPAASRTGFGSLFRAAGPACGPGWSAPEGIPRTTNGLEGRVHLPLKDLLGRHRAGAKSVNSKPSLGGSISEIPAFPQHENLVSTTIYF